MQTFNKFKGFEWIQVSFNNKLKMIIIANICTIPSWLLYYFGGLSSIYTVEEPGLYYLVLSAHNFLLYYVLLGFLPMYVFPKLNLVNKNRAFYYEPKFAYD